VFGGSMAEAPPMPDHALRALGLPDGSQPVPRQGLSIGSGMTESERIKLTILLHQYTPAERLSAMEIRHDP
jgi:hypothetical protein